MLNIGLWFDEDERYNDAIEVNEKAIALSIGSEVLSGKIALAYLRLGIVNEHIEEPRKAIDLYKKAYSMYSTR